jgi:hypothetical protein
LQRATQDRFLAEYLAKRFGVLGPGSSDLNFCHGMPMHQVKADSAWLTKRSASQAEMRSPPVLRIANNRQFAVSPLHSTN